MADNILLIGEKELDDLLLIKERYSKSLLTLNNIQDTLSYNDKDEYEKLVEIQNEVDNFINEIRWHNTRS